MGFNYERMTFNPSVQNWPDLREMNGTSTATTPVYGETWCHGAPGIALSRLRAWELTGDQNFRNEAEIALATTYKNVYQQLTQSSDSANYSLCHGLAGNADILLVGAQKLQKQHVFSKVAAQAGELGIEKHDKTGLNWLSGVNDPLRDNSRNGRDSRFYARLSRNRLFLSAAGLSRTSRQ